MLGRRGPGKDPCLDAEEHIAADIEGRETSASRAVQVTGAGDR